LANLGLSQEKDDYYKILANILKDIEKKANPTKELINTIDEMLSYDHSKRLNIEKVEERLSKEIPFFPKVLNEAEKEWQNEKEKEQERIKKTEFEAQELKKSLSEKIEVKLFILIYKYSIH